jgi:DNA-directed RNA polymerase subunit RPC12/RpoP
VPVIYNYRCMTCNLSFPQGWGSYTYVKNSRGEKVVCPHPMEMDVVYEILGNDASDELIREMIGQNYDCLCLSCLSQFEMDVDKEPRSCPNCNSNQVSTVLELVDGVCPKCKGGTIIQKDTGAQC